MKKILIVDDNIENLLILEKILVKEGFEIVKTYDGKTATKLALAENPDLILLDIMMPDIDGISVCRYLSANEKTKWTPIILITARTDPEAIQEGLQSGAHDFIKKPYDKIDLLARINGALKLREMQLLNLELEKLKTFEATVMTANHKIKQPLTLINLSISSIRRELTKDIIDKEAIYDKTEKIEIAVKNIIEILEEFNAVRKINYTKVADNIRLIDMNKKNTNPEN